MSRLIDMAGQKFGRLTVIERDTSKPKGQGAYWICQCDCGNQTSVLGKHLRRENIKSCGCLQGELFLSQTTHGMTQTKIYKLWLNMRSRCHNPKSSYFARYGGRGIAVCDEWRDSFENFFAHVSKLPHFGEAGYSLDRINNDGDYEPGNVRFATVTEQARNRADNRVVEIHGKRMTVVEIAELAGTAYSTIHDRLKRGLSGEELLQPAQR